MSSSLAVIVPHRIRAAWNATYTIPSMIRDGRLIYNAHLHSCAAVLVLSLPLFYAILPGKCVIAKLSNASSTFYHSNITSSANNTKSQTWGKENAICTHKPEQRNFGYVEFVRMNMNVWYGPGWYGYRMVPNENIFGAWLHAEFCGIIFVYYLSQRHITSPRWHGNTKGFRPYRHMHTKYSGEIIYSQLGIVHKYIAAAWGCAQFGA